MEKAFQFDQAALYEVEAVRTPAFVKYRPANCRHCAAFDFTSPLWSVITAKTGATLWSARCTEPGVKAVCKDRGLAFEEAEGAEEQLPVFEVWTGAAWRRYRDLSDPEGLLRYLQEEGYVRDDDPRHLMSSIDWSDPLTVAYAKHAARSPQNDWASLGAPWPLWAPCDAPSTYARLCEPRLPDCVTLVDDTETSRGLGSALFRYAAPAAEAFAQGCAVSFVDSPSVCVHSRGCCDDYSGHGLGHRRVLNLYSYGTERLKPTHAVLMRPPLHHHPALPLPLLPPLVVRKAHRPSRPQSDP